MNGEGIPQTNHACGEKQICLPYLAEQLGGFFGGHELFKVTNLASSACRFAPRRILGDYYGVRAGGVTCHRHVPTSWGVGGSRIVYILFIALWRVVAFRKEGGGMRARFYWEPAHKENHALIPPGASAPSLHKGFISVFVNLPPPLFH